MDVDDTGLATSKRQRLGRSSAAYRCTAGDTLITVMPDGTLYPCRRMPIDAGNLHQTPLAELYDGALFRQLRDPAIVAGGCEKFSYERLFRGGLRCLSYATKKSFVVADPGCWLATRQGEKQK